MLSLSSLWSIPEKVQVGLSDQDLLITTPACRFLSICFFLVLHDLGISLLFEVQSHLFSFSFA